MSEETYQDDLRYERAVWPEKFGKQPTTMMTGIDLNTVFDDEMKRTREWQERVLLALQGIDVSLEVLANKPPIEITTINGQDAD